MATKPPFRDYISQTSSLRASTSQQNETIASQNAAASQTKLKSATSSAKQRLKFAITRQLSQLLKQVLPLASQNLAYSLYQSYKSQGEENPQTKAQAVAQVEAQLSQLESSLATYRVSMQVQVPSKPMCQA